LEESAIGDHDRAAADVAGTDGSHCGLKFIEKSC
jgi:hypothetical protein